MENVIFNEVPPVPRDWEYGDAAWGDHWQHIVAQSTALGERLEDARKYASKDRHSWPGIRPQMVYFVQAHCGSVKIGRAMDVKKRLAVMQVHHPQPLALLGTAQGGASLERALHAEFASDLVRGEWYRCSDRLLARIADLC